MPSALPFLLAFTLAAETHQIVATQYHHTFSAAHPVLLRVLPGDVIVTKTVDSAGFDFQGIRRTKTHGNPLTGPFFIEGAEPGDALAVKLARISLNRPTGYTAHRVPVKDLAPHLVPPPPRPNAVIPGYDTLIPWTIDLTHSTVRPAEPGVHKLAPLPASPMLGCIGVAPQGDYSPRSGPAGYWGGNLDYNLIREGATVYLPVFHKGGLLFFGDGHALQGDGEPIGSGVETSLDVSFTVELRKNWKLTGPRAETAREIISIGGAPEATLNQSIEIANRDMLRWLIEEYAFPPLDAHLAIGVQARYDILTLGGSIAIRMPKPTPTTHPR
ncbi:MAG: acetamidase/formamidase family protein [Bryobacterales bacterium]|nr:acetamidase/formamidase family protein [Bryobacterales bacterium]